MTAFQSTLHISLGFNERFLSLLAATIFAATQLCVLNAGEQEVTALAKLFPSELIAVQRIETGLSPEEIEFSNEMSRRGEEAMKKSPGLQFRMKEHAEAVKGGTQSQSSLPDEVVDKLSLSAEEVAKLNLILAKGDFPIRRTGPIIFYEVQRENDALKFRRKQVGVPVASDAATDMIERLLSTLELRLDATSAQLLGVTIGPAKWVDTTQSKHGDKTGKGKGLQWSGVGLRSPQPLNIAGVPVEDKPLQATVWCMYKAEHKMTICSIAIKPEGSEDTASEKALFMVTSAPAKSNK